MKSLAFLGVAALLLTATTPLSAQTAFVPTKLIQNFNEAEIAPVLAMRKIDVVGRYSGQQGAYLEVKFENGTPAVLTFNAKQPNSERHIGLATLVVLTPRPEWTVQRKLELMVNFNRQNLLTQVGLYDNGMMYIQRYSICDFGLAQGNLAAELQLLELGAKRLQDELAKP